MKLVHINTDKQRQTSTFFLKSKQGQHIGMTQVRHKASHSPELPSDCANHIYYEIKPEYRRKGYGTIILKLVLEKAYDIGLKNIIICCDESNTASQKIIKKNGGEFVGRYKVNQDDYILKYIFKNTEYNTNHLF